MLQRITKFITFMLLTAAFYACSSSHIDTSAVTGWWQYFNLDDETGTHYVEYYFTESEIIMHSHDYGFSPQKSTYRLLHDSIQIGGINQPFKLLGNGKIETVDRGGKIIISRINEVQPGVGPAIRFATIILERSSGKCTTDVRDYINDLIWSSYSLDAFCE